MSESRSSSPAGGPGPVRRRALVVDDEAPLVKLVGSYLEREGFEVASASDGEQAVERARAFDADVIVLDLMLPGIDGIEACRRIRAFSDAYIVMLTARVEEIDKIVGLSTGADDYVTKPFSPGELVARIRAMLRRPRTGPADEGAAGALAISRSTRRRARCAGAAIRSS
jgi:DNA-binding response OmpR family regulator